MAVKNTGRTVPDTYLELVQQFRLTRIRDDDHLSAAQEMIERLLEQDQDAGAQEYLDVLTDLVEAYEDKNHPIPDATESDVLRELLRSNALSQSQLARTTGISQSTISAVLNGNRSFTREQLVGLAKVFGVSPSAFLPA